MTKQELIELIEDSGELVREEGQLYHTTYLFDEESAGKLSDAIIALQNERLKEFVDWYKKVLVEDYDDKAKYSNKFFEKEKRPDWFYVGQMTAIQRLIDTLDRDLEAFLEEHK